MTYYERLGVAPDATPAEVRSAYRYAARRHHPDAAGERSAAAMAEINEAWRVLGDPQRRRDYDLTLAGPSPARPSTASPTEPSESDDDDEPVAPRRPAYNPLARYQDPPRFPWRFMAILAAIGVVVILVGVAISSPPKQRPPDNVLTPGSCVVVQRNGDVAEVNCTSAHDGVVVTLVAFDERCEFGLEPHRDKQGMGVACISTGVPPT